MVKRLRLLSIVFLVGTVACGGGGGGTTNPAPDDGDASVGGGPQDGAVATAPDVGSVTCTGAISNTAPPANEVAKASAAPAPTGGTVADGLYYLTEWTVYTGSEGQSGTRSKWLKVTLRVTGTTWKFAITDSDGGSDIGTQAVSYAGTTFAATLYCPPPSEAKAAAGYSATVAELRVYDPSRDSAGMSELVFTKQ